MPPPRDYLPRSIPVAARELSRRHPQLTVFVFLLIVSAAVTWPAYGGLDSLVSGALQTLAFASLLFTVERTLGAPWPYHYAWAIACVILAIAVPVAGSIYFGRPFEDVLVNTLILGGPCIALALYTVLHG